MGRVALLVKNAARGLDADVGDERLVATERVTPCDSSTFIQVLFYEKDSIEDGFKYIS